MGEVNNRAVSAADAVLAEQVAPVVEAAGLYLEEARILRAGRHTTVRIVVDLPSGTGGVGADELDSVSRELSASLDQSDPVKGAYELEVSTPGAERKLTTPRHFSRSLGRLVSFRLSAGEAFEARIQAVDDDGVVVTREEKVPKSNKVIVSEPRHVKFEDVVKARVLVEMRDFAEGEE